MRLYPLELRSYILVDWQCTIMNIKLITRFSKADALYLYPFLLWELSRDLAKRMLQRRPSGNYVMATLIRREVRLHVSCISRPRERTIKQSIRGSVATVGPCSAQNEHRTDNPRYIVINCTMRNAITNYGVRF